MSGGLCGRGGGAQGFTRSRAQTELRDEKDDANVRRAVLDRLATLPLRWLLLIDNADAAHVVQHMLRRCLPPRTARCHVLLTSRRDHFPAELGLRHPMRLGKLERLVCAWTVPPIRMLCGQIAGLRFAAIARPLHTHCFRPHDMLLLVGLASGAASDSEATAAARRLRRSDQAGAHTAAAVPRALCQLTLVPRPARPFSSLGHSIPATSLLNGFNPFYSSG